MPFVVVCSCAKATNEFQVRGAKYVKRLAAVLFTHRHLRQNPDSAVLLHDSAQRVVDLQAVCAVVRGLFAACGAFERRSERRTPVPLQESLQAFLAKAVRAQQNPRVLEETAADRTRKFLF